MSSSIGPEFFDFLRELKDNNNRDTECCRAAVPMVRYLTKALDLEF